MARWVIDGDRLHELVLVPISIEGDAEYGFCRRCGIQIAQLAEKK